MAIQELSIHGYRSLRDVTWRPGQLNLVVGPNASGKSNLLRAIELISVAARGDLEETISKSGGIYPLLWDHQAGEFGWKVRIDPVDPGRNVETSALTFSMKIAQLRGMSGFEIEDDSLGNWFEFERGTTKIPFWFYSRQPGHVQIYNFQQSEWEEDITGEGGGFELAESLLSQISDFRNPIVPLTKRTLEGWRVFHDVQVDRGAPMRRPATTQFSRRLHADGSNFLTVLHTLYTGNRDFKHHLDEGMQAAFGEEYKSLEFQPAAAQQIQLAIQWKSSSDPHAGSDLSDGTLRFLFLLTVLCNPESPQVVAIDEPEAGLHPSMLPIIAEYAAAASERTQIILTSHSPEFLDAFTEFSPSVTLCHWEDGETSLHPLDSNKLGVWLERYRLGDLFSRGELEVLALPDVDSNEQLEERLDAIPSEDDALAASDTP